ncbi:MAG: four helix bundle protein [Nevskiaceae bacterium]|nr:MAG: four helix bundle protein [Nevskiaceae bacterium]TBR73862.1 MAG: four helix bundle protein [Nevskiaceae bacterium]
MRRHEQLHAWQSAMRLIEQIYKLTEQFPATERYGLTDQLRRAAVSVPSNIAEGAARGSQADCLRFLYMARGSLSEVDTQTKIAQRLGYIVDTQEVENQLEECFAQLGGLINHLKAKASK